MNRSNLFKTLLIAQTIGILLYTFYAFKLDGAILFNVFFENILSLNWSGQFNLDFLSYLSLSGIWIMWRNKFTKNSILLAITAIVLGIIVFAPYLLWLTKKENGDMKKLLLGNR